MSRLAMIDDFFATTLTDESIRTTAGKVLPTEYKRFIYFMKDAEYKELLNEIKNGKQVDCACDKDIQRLLENKWN